MRERGANSTPGAVAPATSASRPAPTAPSYQDSEEYDDESDWDVGVGSLVIDLDADLEKCHTPSTPPVAPTAPAPGTMSGVEHQATDHKGLKMKIKRKNVPKVDGKESNKETKTALVPVGAEAQCQPAAVATQADKTKEKERTNKGRSVHKKNKDRTKVSGEQMANGSSMAVPGSTSGSGAVTSNNVSGNSVIPAGSNAGSVSVELDPARRDLHSVDPFEFNPKLEDRFLGFPHKKGKVDKVETASSPIVPFTQDACVDTSDACIITEPECLGPCDPGTSVMLEGIVWQETEHGMLVVNVTWRGKTYVGTLLDATRHDWAPPRFNCDSPTSDMEARTPKGRGKRRAAAANLSLNESTLGDTRKLRKGRSGRNIPNTFQAPPSPAKSDISLGMKRKGRAADLEINLDGPKGNKRCRTTSNSRSTASSGRESPVLIECPERNCNKKYRHINGLRYHQSHAHQPGADGDGDDKDGSSEESGPQSPVAASVSERGAGKRCKRGRDVEEEEQSSRPSSPCNNTSPGKPDNTPPTPSKDKLKADSGNLRKDTIDAGLKVTEKDSKTSPPDAKVVVTSGQLFQISGGTLVGTSPLLASQAAAPLTAQTITTASLPVGATITSVPVTMAANIGATLVTVQELKVEKDADKKKKGCDKNKSKTLVAARPIVPAPSPGMGMAGAPAMGNMGGSQLKPIQPKPTIMGEVATPNPALAGLSKEKKAKKKKVRDREGHGAPPSQGAVPTTNSGTAQQPLLIKEEPRDSLQSKGDMHKQMPSVIKSASPLKVLGEGPERTRELGMRLPQDMSKPGAMEATVKLEVNANGQTPDQRLAQPPTSLSVSSPLQVATEPSDHTGDVQSPAYSDISDESAPMLENEGVVKVKEEDKASSQESKAGEASDHSLSSGYGMYHSYYGHPPYLMPAVATAAASPSPQGGVVTPGKDKEREVKVEPGIKDGSKEGLKSSEQKMLSQQQQLLYQQYYQQHYPNYHPHMALMDPHYQRAMEEQRRAEGERPPSTERRDSRPPSAGCQPSQSTNPMHSPAAPSHSPSLAKGAADKGGKPPALISSKERKQREVDANLKDKQSETLQILKENIEIKHQMEARGRPEDQQRRQELYDQQRRDEYQRYHMQALAQEERRRLADPKAMDAQRRTTTPTKDMADKSRDLAKPTTGDAARETARSREYAEARQKEMDAKRGDKSKDGESGRGVSPSPRSTPKSKDGAGPPQGQPLPASYGQYVPHAFLQQPHYAQVPFEGGHPMYRGVSPLIGYPGPAYLHPAQVRYLPPDAIAAEKEKMLASPGAQPGEPVGKPIDLVQQQYYASAGQGAPHKIHELQEVAKARQSNSSSPAKRTDTASPAERSESGKVRTPPPQRHLHTHHHTHVVNPGYPLYDPYGAGIIQQAAGPPSIPHPFLPSK